MDLSIIIPCYNSGMYILDALDSLENIVGDYKYEVIIVDDGSSDDNTIGLLRKLDKNKFIVIHQQNKGPAGARNTGVKHSKGEFLLFLDSDNKTKPTYPHKAITFLKTHNEFGVVYGRPDFFGAMSYTRFKTGPFNFNYLLHGNFIDMCAIIRRKVWEDVSGLDENRTLIGFEDWEFWIRVSLANWKFHFINEKLFDYRISDSSLVMSVINTDKQKKVFDYVYNKHMDIFIENFRKLSSIYAIYLDDKRRPFRSFIKYLYYKFISNSNNID